MHVLMNGATIFLSTSDDLGAAAGHTGSNHSYTGHAFNAPAQTTSDFKNTLPQ